MKLLDIILTILCGETAALVLADFLKEYDQYQVLKWLLLFLVPVLSIIVLWGADLVSKKYRFVLEVVKYFLIGVLATLFDLKVFEFLTWIIGFDIAIVNGFSKAISFLVAVFIKFVGNKYWTFQENSSNKIKDELAKFLLVTFAGLLLDVGAFYYFSKILGPQFDLPDDIWVKISVIMAAIVAAIWNFLSYKFIVFKKDKITENDSSISQIPPANI